MTTLWINVSHWPKYPSSPYSAEVHDTEEKARTELFELFNEPGLTGCYYSHTIIVDGDNARVDNWTDWAAQAVLEDRQLRRDQDAHNRSLMYPS